MKVVASKITMNVRQDPFCDVNISVFSPSPDLSQPSQWHMINIREFPAKFFKGSWYQTRFVRNRGLLTQYPHGCGFLLDSLSVRAFWNRAYTRRLVVSQTTGKTLIPFATCR